MLAIHLEFKTSLNYGAKALLKQSEVQVQCKL